MSEAALEVESLGLSLDGNCILDAISFAVQSAEFVSIIGPNGAGKTSLLKCLNRIYRTTAGSVRIFGKNQNECSQRELARHIGYVPQGGAQGVQFTVREFVLLARYAHIDPFSPPSTADHEAASDTLVRLQLESFADRTMSTLSGGERQLVLLAAAIAQGASILLLDEAASFLDYRHQVEIRQRLRDLNGEHGITILSVTHDVSQAALDSDRILALDDGALCFDGTPEALLEGDHLERIFGTRFYRIDSPGGIVLVPDTSETAS